MKSTKTLILAATMLALPIVFTSCDDILGEWSRPAPVTPSDGGEGDTPTPVCVSSISLKSQTKIAKGSSETLTISVAPDNATDKSVTWSSNNDAVATVDQSGLVTALAAGTAIITATAKDGSGVYATCNVTVDGLLAGVFTVSNSPSLKKVLFSQGNLQAVCTSADDNIDTQETWTWQFAENQWDCIGGRYTSESEPQTGNNYINGNGSVSTAGAVDLFGWSTAATYYGIHNSVSEYTGDFVDWGKLAISNGGNTANSDWRMLTNDEWNCLFYTRTASTVAGTSNARFAKAKLFDTTHGIILFPDNYTHPEGITVPIGINKTDNTSWSANQYTAAEWAKMEAAGAVFLPAAGYRYNTLVYNLNFGYYWSSSPYNASDAKYVQIYSTGLSCGYPAKHHFGYSVRLVHDVVE
jgi:hypothetical protein